MIVTCPGCASNYRVRNEAVPAEGARMRCPKCSTMFLAKPPTAEELAAAGEAPSVPAPSPVTGVHEAYRPPAGAGGPQPASLSGALPAQNPFAAAGASGANGLAPASVSGVSPAASGAFPSASASGALPAQNPFASASGALPAQNPFASASASGVLPAQNPFAPAPGGAPASASGGNPFAPPPGSPPPAARGPAPGADPFAARPSTGALGATSAADPFAARPSTGAFGAASGADPFAARPGTAGAPTTPVTGAAARSATDPFAELVVPPGASPGAPADDDPFANLDLDAPRPALATPPPTGSGLDLDGPSRPAFAAPPATGPGLDLEPRARSRPAGSAAPPPTRAPVSASPAPRRPASLAAQAGGWAALALSFAALVVGLGFAGWSSGVIDLDEALMARFEEELGVRPPRSFLGKDDPSPQDLQLAAASASDRGDIVAAAVAWRRLVARAPDDLDARQRLTEALKELGETRVAADLAKGR